MIGGSGADTGADTNVDGARPYGLIGLAVSIVLILLAAAMLCVLCAGATFVASLLVVGRERTAELLMDLQAAVRTDGLVAQRLSVALSLVMYVALTLAILGAARFRGKAHWALLVAWTPWKPLRGSHVVWIVAVATVAYGIAADALVSRFYPPSNAWITMPKGVPWIVLFVVLAVAGAPLAEEMFFRGWLYTGLRSKMRAWAAITVTATLFALAHWEKTHIYALAVFPVGIALGVVRERTGSIKASMAVHAVYNGAACALLLIAGT
jgi:uncharacterized protein